MTDAVHYLKGRAASTQKQEVLLMVYPITANDFTASVIKQFKGDVVCVAGTQNGSGDTGFKGEMVDEWFEKNMAGWEMLVKVPLLSFPGKDEALFIFKKK